MNQGQLLLLVLLAPVALAGCELIEGIFKAGVWVGVILVLAVIGIIVWLVSKSASYKSSISRTPRCRDSRKALPANAFNPILLECL